MAASESPATSGQTIPSWLGLGLGALGIGLAIFMAWRHSQQRSGARRAQAQQASDIKRLEEALKDNKERYRRLEANIPGMVYSFTCDIDRGKVKHAFPSVNAGSRELFGIEPEDLMRDGSLLADSIHPEDRERRDASIKHSAETLQPWREELRHIVKGEVRWHDCMSRPERQADGRILWTGIIFDITERKRSEEQLRQTQFCVDEAAIAIFQMDADARVLNVNDQACRSLGYAREELCRLSVYDFDATFSTEKWAEHRRQLVAHGSRTFESIHRRKDGSTFPVEITVTYHEIQGRGFSVAFARDITERKLAGEALREGEERLRLALRAANQGLYDLNIQTGEFQVSPEYATMLGHHPAEFHETTDRWMERLHPDDRERTANTFYAYLRGEIPVYAVEFRLQTKSGGWKWIFSRGRIVAEDAEGKPLRMLGTHTDITERKQAEGALRESEERFRRLVEHSPDAIFVEVWPDFAYLNPAAVRLFGANSADELIGCPVLDRIHPDFHELVLDRVQRLEKTRRPVPSLEQVYLKLDGTAVPAEAAAAPLNYQGRNAAVVFVRDITARRQAEQTLRESEERFRRLVENSPDAIFVQTQERFAYLNPAAVRLFGATSVEQVRGQPVVERIHPEFRGAVVDRIRDVNEKRLPCPNIEEIYLRLDGTPVPVEVGAAPITYEGKPGAVVFVRDVTERRRAEEALRQSEVQLQCILGATADGILTVDNHGKVIQANRRFAELWRIPQALLDAGDDTALLNFVVDQLGDPETFLKKVQALYGTEAVDVDTLVFKDGRVFERYSSPLMLKGAVAGRVWSFRDVTARQRAEEALRESEERHRSLFATSLDAVLLTAPDGRIFAANDAASRMFGCSEDELKSVGRDGVVDASDSRLEAALAERARTGRFTGVLTLRRKDGTKFFGEVSSVMFTGHDGQCCTSMIIRDITERRRAEETRARLEAELRQAQKMETLGQLAGGVAHDFSNVLTVILTTSGLLADDPNLSPAARQLVRQTTAAATHAANLTRQLLAFSRRHVARIRRVNLSALLGDVTQMLGRLLGENISLQCEIAPGLPWIEADAGMVEQVILNLALNARDAMRQGGQLTIRAYVQDLTPDEAKRNPEARAGQFVVLSVTDTGCGMDQATLARLFEPFFTTKDPGKGTGLGLATIHGIMKQHQGWIEVASQVNQGSTFEVFLPAANAEETELATSEQAPTLVEGHETVLVVEDEAAVRDLVGECLRRCGFRVLEAGTGAEALRIWKQHRDEVDLLLTDIVMPEGMSGRELGEQLQAEKPGLKLVYTSGHGREIADADTDFLAGNFYLPKPFTPAVLTRTVRQCLDAR